MYDAIIGRFFSEDPIRIDSGDSNFYLYCKNDPVNLADPSGLVPEPELSEDIKLITNLLKELRAGDYLIIIVDGAERKLPKKTDLITLRQTLASAKIVTFPEKPPPSMPSIFFPPPKKQEIAGLTPSAKCMARVKDSIGKIRRNFTNTFRDVKNEYIECAKKQLVPVSPDEFDKAVIALADAYIACMLAFLRKWPHPFPQQGELKPYEMLLGDTPWCADYCNFFFGGTEAEDPCLEKAMANSPLINKYFQLFEGQWHESMTADKQQHNYGIIYPKSCTPQLRPGVPLPPDKCIEDPKTGKPQMSNDPLIVILDPWQEVFPSIYTCKTHPLPPTNTGDVNIGK